MDYADYLTIVYNNDIDTAFRNQAMENIHQLFAYRSAYEQPVPDHIIPGNYRSLQFIIDSIEIINPLERQVTETYKGRMQYSFQILGITATDTMNLDTSLHQMGMLLQMRLKDFGENSLLVWEVLLISD